MRRIDFFDFSCRSIATGLGSGYLPKAPGTWGTLLAVPIAWLLGQGGDLFYLGSALLLLAAGLFSVAWLEGTGWPHDSKEVVIDEIVGFIVAMSLLPMTWQVFLLAFVSFRLLDILKPFPIGWIDRHTPGAAGVMGDDLLAGVFVNVALHLLLAYSVWAQGVLL